MTLRVCSQPGCPALTDKGKCTEHRAAAEQARGSRQQRGYDAAHDRERRRWAPLVAAGQVKCARGCGNTVAEPWDLGHTDDRRGWTGPECASCNRSAGGRAAHPKRT